MTNEASAPPEKKTESDQWKKPAPLIGAVIGALLARPVIKPWLDAHWSGRISFNDWPFVAALIPWILFSVYWEIQSKNSTPALSSESRMSRAVHVVLSNTALLLIIIPVPGLTMRLVPNPLILRVSGLALECAGLALAVWARRILGRNWSGEITIKQDHELVRSGPYGRLRHPIYTGLLAMYAGTAILIGQTHALAGLLLGVIAYLRKTRMEEVNLLNAFGKRYKEYRENTWALVPGLY